jgi:hypothetical protein
MFAQGRKDERTNADHYYVTPSLRGENKRVYGLNIYKPEITEFKRMGDRH